MNQCLVDSVNSRVKEDDYLVHLGDWSFGGIDNIWNFRKQINCNNIILILGNHDQHIKDNKLLSNVAWKVEKDGYEIDPYLVDRNPEYFEEGCNAKQLFHSVNDLLRLTVSSDRFRKITFEICHYPIAVWNKMHHGRIHLHGHPHGNYNTSGKLLDIGVDNRYKLFGNYEPFSIYEILDYMKDKEVILKDHHNENTN